MDELKWPAIAIIGVVIAISAGSAFETFAKNRGYTADECLAAAHEIIRKSKEQKP